MRDSSFRRPGLDLARNLAIILVVVQHIVFLGGLANDDMSFVHKIQARFLEAVSQSCVDLFGLLSGYLGVTSLVWNWRKFGRLWLQVWATGLLVLGGCSLIGLICPSVFSGRLPTLDDWLTAAFPILRDEYWYFTAYLFVFLLAPLINRFLFAEGRERTGYVIAGGMLLLVCGSTVCPGGVDWLPLAKGYSSAWLVGLYILGGALFRLERRLGDMRAGWFFAFAAIGVGITVAQRLLMSVLPSLKEAFADEWTLAHYTSPTVTLTAAALLLGCARLRLTAFGGRLARACAALAPCAFGIYLLHVQPFFFRRGFVGRFAFLDNLPDWLFAGGVLLVAITLYLLLAGLESLRRRSAAGLVAAGRQFLGES